ncbi:hypothetical protein O3P69_008588 [Scylla paramamosain]|uniref:Uncharacterized protein n=1 Tax=Scylla paramamosain TaxID=85552 RepID=A0AAW0SLT6_SCYPA
MFTSLESEGATLQHVTVTVLYCGPFALRNLPCHDGRWIAVTVMEKPHVHLFPHAVSCSGCGEVYRRDNSL